MSADAEMDAEMDCETYRAHYPRFSARPLARDVWKSAAYQAFTSHVVDCDACSDWSAAARLRARGLDLSRHPCVHIASEVYHHCEQHPDLRECPDVLVVYRPRFDEYVIAKGDVVRTIRHCPWCGVALPPSKRQRWFAELEALGIEHPLSCALAELPEKYRDDTWHHRS